MGQRAQVILAALAATALAGCGSEPPPPTDAATSATTQAAPHGPVVAEALAGLAARVEDPPAPTTEQIEAAAEPVAGLLEALAGTPARDSMRPLLLEELVQLGDAIVPHLAALLAEREGPADQRAAAAEALGALGSIAGADALLDVVERSRTEPDPEHWLIAQAAWRLSETDQDWILPRVVLCLKYEKDHESVLWLAHTAARFGNFSGLAGLRVIAEGDGPVRDRAAGLYQQLAAPLYEHDERGAELAWYEGNLPESAAHVPSDRLALETWRRIEALAEWQLRGVDDARFVLSRSGAYAAAMLAEALADEDLYVRVHAAQSLERMGPRGGAASDALLAALDDPSVAPAAAAALGSVTGDAARESVRAALVGRLTPPAPMELRVAAARALGALDQHLDPPPPHPELAALARDATAPIELRAAAAAARVRTAPLDQVGPEVAQLRDLLDSIAIEVTEVEAALWAWLVRSDLPDDALLTAWDDSGEQDRTTRARTRAALVDEALGQTPRAKE